MPTVSDDLSVLKLIDFGIASRYSKTMEPPKCDEDHVENGAQRFRGNYAFCSPNSLLNKTTSRRDDMISLLYILVFLMTHKVPFIDEGLNSE